MLHVLGNQWITPAEVKAIISTVDNNGDGKIDYQEFVVLMKMGLGHSSQPKN